MGRHVERERKRTRTVIRDPDPPPARIIVADDDGEMRTLIAHALRRDGHEVVEVCDGMELLQYLATHQLEVENGQAVDLLISDIRMPGRNGLDVLAGMRGADWSIPVILITAVGDAQVHAEARRLGAAAVFDKPFDLDDLRTLTLNLVG
jgi:CheY-like chemotaxis protein